MKIISVARVSSLLLSIFGTSLALAQSVTAPPPSVPPARISQVPAPPTLDVRGAEQPVTLHSLDVSVEIIAGVARTRVEMLFVNPNARVLEGELQFPLLGGQQIDGFALDINGVLRDAVPVEKAKGKQVFEDTIRSKVDPALLESTIGENFRLRVYPLPAKGNRRVVVYTSETLESRNSHYLYRLPLSHAKALAEFSLDVSVASSNAQPTATLPRELGGAMTLQASGVQYRGTIRRADFIARGWLEVAIPEAAAGSAQPASALVQEFSGSNYLYADLPVAIRHVPRKLPARVGIVWDSSASGAARDHAAEFILLDAYFKALGNGEVRLTRVRDVAEPTRTFAVRNGNWSELKHALQDTVYDGATDLAAWRADADVGEILLFSDGLANYGQGLAPTTLPTQHIYPVVASASANRALLRNFAQSTVAYASGAIIDLTADMQSATQALLLSQSEIVAIESSGDVDVRADAEAWSRGRLRLHGVIRGESPRMLSVHLRDPGGARRTLDVPVVVDSSVSGQPSQVPLAARLWARARIDSLEGDRLRNRAEIRRIGETFAMITRETSLIVLDTVADYVRHDIAPPSALRGEFDALKQASTRRELSQRSANLDRIAHEYAQKIAWWQRSYPKGPPARSESKGEIAEDRQSADAVADGRAMARAQSPRPAPAPAAEAAAAPSAQRAVAGGASMKSVEADAGMPPEIGITLKKWTPDAAYISRFRDAADDDLYAAYLGERADWKDSSAFVLDSADALFDRHQPELALRVLSNLAEMDLENRQILRILGYRLLQAGKPQLAVPLFEQVRDLAPFEPQSFRDLGLAYAAAGSMQKAVDALYEVVVRQWDGRFAEVALIALSELNALIAAHPGDVDTDRYDVRLLRNLPVDLRVVLNWDADNSDMDLWVTDPNGERAYYGNRLTRQGGRMSADLTGGYGPEEFMLKVAKPGKYKVEANYYGNRQQLVASTVSLRLALITGFGSAIAKEQSVILRLGGRSESVLVGEFEVGGSGDGSQ